MKRFASPGAPRFAPALALAPLLMAGVMLALAVAASPAAAIDLAGVLREVEAANPTLAARRAMTEAARRRVAPAGAWPSPMLEVGAINVPTSGRFDADPMTMKMIGVAQRVPIFGATRLSSGAARAAAGAEAAATTTTRNELLGAATEAYADAYAAIELRRLAAAHVGDTDRLVLSARARYESGAGRLEDVLRAGW